MLTVNTHNGLDRLVLSRKGAQQAIIKYVDDIGAPPTVHMIRTRANSMIQTQTELGRTGHIKLLNNLALNTARLSKTNGS